MKPKRLCTIVIAAWLVSVPAQASTFPGANGKIFFSRTTFTPSVVQAIYSINADGTGLHQVSSPGAGSSDSFPRTSPDGQSVVFRRSAAGTAEIWIANADGGGAHQLTSTPAQSFAFGPSFSADGKSVLYDVGSAANPSTDGIYQIDVTGANQHRLMAGNLQFPTAAAGGKRLAFVDNSQSSAQVEVAAADGSGASPIYTAQSHADAIGWAPGCGTLVVADTPGIVQVPGGGGNAQTLVATTPTTIYDAPSYSPDGARLVFPATPTANESSVPLDTSNVNGSGLAPIPNTGGSGVSDTEPDWAVAPGTSTPAAAACGSNGGGGKASSTVAVICNYTFATFSERCTATVRGGGASAPTGQVRFSSANGGVFAAGDTCTLANTSANTASCAVTFDPPSHDLATSTTVHISAAYLGDNTHLTASGGTQFGTQGVINQQQRADAHAQNSAPTNVDPQTALSTGIPITITIVVPGTLDVIASSGSGGTLPIAHDAKAKKAIILATLHKTFTKRGGRQRLHLKLTATGRRIYKKLLAADKAYHRKHPHGHHAPKLKLRITLKFTRAR